MKLWFINRFFYPDESATSQLLTDLATELSADFDVSVVCSMSLDPVNETRLPARENWQGVAIYRLTQSRLGSKSLLWKAWDLFRFQMAAGWFVLRKVRKSDLVVLMTDPPLMPLGTTALVRLKGGGVINWVQDVYPELAARLNKFPGPQWLLNALVRWRNKSLRVALTNVVISPRMAAYLQGCGLSNVQVIHNWADESGAAVAATRVTSLRTQWGLDGKLVVMYSGNFGRVHSFSEIQYAVKKLANHSAIHFVFTGKGAALEDFRAEIEAINAGNVSFKPFQPRNALAECLQVADLHLVSLKPGMEDLVMPSKLYGVLAVGRPVAFIGEPGSAIADFISNKGIGFSIPSGSGDALVQGIEQFFNEPEAQDRCGKSAQMLYMSEFSRRRSVAKWRAVLNQNWISKACVE